MPHFARNSIVSQAHLGIEETMLTESMNILWNKLTLTIKGLLCDQSNYHRYECHLDLLRTP